MISNINVNELKYINKNIIDIRNTEKYNNNHIPNSINIPSEKLLQYPERYLNKEESYYLYCQKGLTSYNVCRILALKGYKVININGGYESWIINK